MLKVSFHTFGCKTNVYDSENMAKRISGFDIVESQMKADIHVVNTCTVTSSSDAQARNLIRRLDKSNKGSKIFITGCYAKRKTEEIQKLIRSLNEDGKNEFILTDKVELCESEFLEDNGLKNFRTRVFVKIGDGCDNFCSYCIIPFVRGKPWSRDIDDVVNEIRTLESKGVKEAVLTSMCISSYEHGLENLLEEILRKTQNIRIRLSSLRPSKISNNLLKLMLNKRICPHLHISLQSGSDGILEKMNRKDYRAEDFVKICNEAKELLKERNPFIAADMIVGFPGETEEDFAKTMDILKRSNVDKLHVFVFSPRPGTTAASIKIKDGYGFGKQTLKFKKELLKLSDKHFKEFQKSMVGKEVEVIWETDTEGHSENYSPVKGKGRAGTSAVCTIVKYEKGYLLS